jgi:hypothetical protein
MCLGARWPPGPATTSTRSPRCNAAGDKFFHGFGAIVLLYSALGLVSNWVRYSSA